MSTTSVAPARAPAASEDPAGSLRLREVLSLAAVLVVVVVLGVVDAGAKSLWFDETISVAVAGMPWREFVHTVTANEANMSVYYLALRGWIVVGGTGEAWIRFLSVLCAVGTVAMLYALARRLFGFRVAIVAALLTALNGFFVQFSQEARSYMLVTLLVTVATYAFVRGIEDGGARWWVLYTAAVTLSVYGHFFAVFFPAAHVMSFALLPRSRDLPPQGPPRQDPRWRPFVASLAVAAVLVVPALRVAWLRSDTQIWWHPPVTIREVSSVFAAMSGGGGAVLAIATALLGALAILGALRLWRREGRSHEVWYQTIGLGMFVVPTAGILAICVLQEIIQIRYFSVVVPGLALVVSLGIVQLPWRLVRGLAVATMVVLSSIGVAHWYDAQKEDWRSPMALVRRDGGSRDAVVLFDPYRIRLYDYYDRDAGTAGVPQLAYPERSFEPFPLYRREAHMSSKSIERMAERYDTVWVLVSNADRPREVSAFARTMERTHRRVRTEHYFRVRVVEWQRI